VSGSEPRQPSDGRGRRGGPPVVDARGARCPVPVIRLARAARGLAPGTTVVLLADDEAAWSDVPAWARMKGHTVTLLEDDDWTEYRVVLGEPRTDRGQADSST
jgi:tRNA 2-thiouridine synthesizing protein A